MLGICDRKVKKAVKQYSEAIKHEYWEGIAQKAQIKERNSYLIKHNRLAIILTAIVFLFIFSFGSYAAQNNLIGYYLSEIFGTYAKNVNGNIIGKSCEAYGLKLSVDAALVENNAILLFYTLTDNEQKIFKDTISLNECSLKAEDTYNFASSIPVRTINGKPGCIVFNFSDPSIFDQKDLKLTFSIDSLKQTTDFVDYCLPLKRLQANQDSLEFGSDSGFMLISCENSGMLADIELRKPDGYNNALPYLVNRITGEEYLPDSQSIRFDKNNDQIYSYSFKNTEDFFSENYDIVIRKEKVYSFDNPMKVEFNIVLEGTPAKEIKLDSLFIESAKIKSIIINQMSIMIDLAESGGNVYTIDNAKYLRQNPEIVYDDGKSISRISNIMTSPDDNGEIRYLIMFDSVIDYNRHPILKIGSKNIPLY